MEKLPYSLESEKAVLGHMLVSRPFLQEAIDGLDESDFYSKNQNAIVFRALKNLHSKGNAVDTVALVNELKNLNLLDSVGGMDYIRSIADVTLSTADASYHLKTVIDYSIVRKLFVETDRLKSEYYSKGVKDIGAYLENYKNTVDNITKNQATSDFFDLSQVVDNLNKKISLKYRSKEKNVLTGIDTGFKTINALTNGWQKGSVNILAARPSVGKTALALNFAWQTAYFTKKTVVLFSLEMSVEQITERLLSSISAVPSRKFRSGDITDSDIIALTEAEDKINTVKFFIDDTSGIKVGDIRAKLTKLRARDSNIGLVVIDYLGLINLANPRQSNKENIDEVMRNLKSIARDLEVPIILLSQLSRDNEKSKRKPVMSDLRDSGSIEQDADIVMLAHRDGYQQSKEVTQDSLRKSDNDSFSSSDIVHLNFAKNRLGPIGEIPLSFMMSISKFVEMDNYKGEN